MASEATRLSLSAEDIAPGPRLARRAAVTLLHQLQHENVFANRCSSSAPWPFDHREHGHDKRGHGKRGHSKQSHNLCAAASAVAPPCCRARFTAAATASAATASTGTGRVTTGSAQRASPWQARPRQARPQPFCCSTRRRAAALSSRHRVRRAIALPRLSLRHALALAAPSRLPSLRLRRGQGKRGDDSC